MDGVEEDNMNKLVRSCVVIGATLISDLYIYRYLRIGQQKAGKVHVEEVSILNGCVE